MAYWLRARHAFRANMPNRNLIKKPRSQDIWQSPGFSPLKYNYIFAIFLHVIYLLGTIVITGETDQSNFVMLGKPLDQMIRPQLSAY